MIKKRIKVKFENGNDKPYVLMKLGDGTRFLAIFDTGANGTTVNKEFLESHRSSMCIENSTEKQAIQVLTLTDTSSVSSYLYHIIAWLPKEHSTRAVPIKFERVKTLELNKKVLDVTADDVYGTDADNPDKCTMQMIIGCYWMKDHDVKIDFKRKTITFSI